MSQEVVILPSTVHLQKDNEITISSGSSDGCYELEPTRISYLHEVSSSFSRKRRRLRESGNLVDLTSEPRATSKDDVVVVEDVSETQHKHGHEPKTIHEVEIKMLWMFPDADEGCISKRAKELMFQISASSLQKLYEALVEQFLTRGYDKKQTNTAAASSSGGVVGGARVTLDFSEADPFSLRAGSPPPSPSYCSQALDQLQNDFRVVSVADVRGAFETCERRYGPAKHKLNQQMDARTRHTQEVGHELGRAASPQSKGKGKGKAARRSTSTAGEKTWTHLQDPLLLKPRKMRPPLPPGTPRSARLVAEVAAVRLREEQSEAERRRDCLREAEDELAVQHGTAQECGCCFGDYAKQGMLQCSEGHMFCVSCVRRYVEESVFGNASNLSGRMPCPSTSTPPCTKFLPASEVRAVLSCDLMRRFDKRQVDDALLRANIPGLVKCPFCDLAVEVPEDQRILKCPRQSCGRESCKLCGEPPHIPLRCSEVERATEAQARLTIEERMTQARLRVCGFCKLALYKEEGCNKITCRCMKVLCYVCRGQITNGYTHFCQHPRNPGQSCDKCNKCSLWTSSKEDDEQAVKEAKKAAVAEQQKKDPDALKLDKRPIGPSARV